MTTEEREAAGIEHRPGAALRPRVLLRYAPRDVLLSGWIRQPEVIADRAAWVRARHGEGTVHLFAFRPHYRGWAHGTMPLLFRAILLDR